MTYYNTPLSNQTPAASQPQMQQNFVQIASSYNSDHVALDQATNAGTHKQVTLGAPLSGDPGKVAPISSLYTKTVSGKSQLFFQNGNLASDVEQLSGGPDSEAGNGWIKFSTGLIMQWGTGNTGGGSSVVVNFPIVFPANVFSVVMTAQDSLQRPIAYDGLGLVSFTAHCAKNGQVFTWIAIGN